MSSSSSLKRIILEGVWVGIGVKGRDGEVREVSDCPSYRRKLFDGRVLIFAPSRNETLNVQYAMLFHSEKGGSAPWRTFPIGDGELVAVDHPDHAVLDVDLEIA